MADRHADVAKRVWFRMLRLESRLGSAVAERLREINLSVPQCDVLTTLTEEEGVSQQMLAKRLYVTKGNISGLLDRLESAGLVERRSTATDRRQYEIHLTTPGREAAVKAIAMQEAVIAATFGQMPEGELKTLERMLMTLRDIVRATTAVPASRVDPLDEPLQYPRPHLVLADLILDAVLEVRIVVDLDHRDALRRLLQVDAVEPGADRARRAQRDSTTGGGASATARVRKPPSLAPFGPCLMICQWPRAI